MREKLITIAFTVGFIFALGLIAGISEGGGPRPTPTPAFRDEGISPQGGWPDLVVSSISVIPVTPTVGSKAIIQVIITNLGGDVPSGNNFYVDLYIDPPHPPTPSEPGISATVPAETCGIEVNSIPWPVQWYQVKAGKSCVLTAEWIFTDTKSYELWAQVDTDNRVSESNEFNNISQRYIVFVDTNRHIVHTSHEDFMKGLANSLVVWSIKDENVNPSKPPYVLGDGIDATLSLGLFREPPLYSQPPFVNGAISPTIVDYNAINPDIQMNIRGTGIYTDYDAMNASVAAPRMPAEEFVITKTNFAVVVWEDGRNGPVYNRDIYLRWTWDAGAHWSNEIKVNDDSLAECGGSGTIQANQLSPSVAVSKNGIVIVAWADNRCGDYDIFVQQYQIDFNAPSLNPVGPNKRIIAAAADQKYPDLTVDEEGIFYLVWEDHRYGNPDIFFTRSITSTGILLWKPESKVSDPWGPTSQEKPAVEVLKTEVISEIQVIDCIPGTPPQAEIAVITKILWVVTVAWEDDRNNPSQNVHDIYMAFSTDRGDTFSVDQRVDDDLSGAEQRDVDIAISQGYKVVEIVVETYCGSAVVRLLAPVADIHVVWQDFRNGLSNPDIYYALVHYEPTPEDPTVYKLTFEPNEKVNWGDDLGWLRGEKAWQGEPTIAARPACPEEGDYYYDVYIAWADSRNYDELNTDIFMAMKTTCPVPPWQDWNRGNGWINWNVNSGARMREANLPIYSRYPPDNPPHTRQQRPAIAVATLNPWPISPWGRIYLVWDDNRKGGKVGLWRENRDVFFATSSLGFVDYLPGYTSSGTYVSPIIDAGEVVTWYIISWKALLPEYSYMTVQTRVGNDLTAFEGDKNWVPWDFPCASIPVCLPSRPCGEPIAGACNRICPYPPSPDDCEGRESGAPLQGYKGPGEHIRLLGITAEGQKLYSVENQAKIAASDGSLFPRARYIQYKINFWTRHWSETPFLQEIVLHYQAPYRVYLPLILKNYP